MCLSHHVGDLFDEVSVVLVCSSDAQLQGQSVFYRHTVGPSGDVQVILLALAKGDVWLNSELMFGLLLWIQVGLCGLRLGNRQNKKYIKVFDKFVSIVPKMDLLFSH